MGMRGFSQEQEGTDKAELRQEREVPALDRNDHKEGREPSESAKINIPSHIQSMIIEGTGKEVVHRELSGYRFEVQTNMYFKSFNKSQQERNPTFDPSSH
jgi:hypothetical protein